VPYAPGGDIDTLVRKIEKRLEQELKQQIVVETKPGASGNIGANILANSNPDGYTWMVAVDSIITSNPYVLPVNYHLDDIKPVTILTSRASILICHSDTNIHSFMDLIRTSHNKKLFFAHGGIGTAGDWLAQSISDFYKLDITTVPYNGTGQALQAIVSKQVDCEISPAGIAHSLILANKLNPIVYTGTEKSVLLKDVPNIHEYGYKGIPGDVYNVLYVNSKTPQHIVDKMINSMRIVMSDPNIVQEMYTLDHKPLVSDTLTTNKKLSIMTDHQARLREKNKLGKPNS
jgi:tripartite-type tricarboxylate transporter receptor subunit TctC